MNMGIELTPYGEIKGHTKDKYDLYKVSINQDELTIEIPHIKEILGDLSKVQDYNKLSQENDNLTKKVKELNKQITNLTGLLNEKTYTLTKCYKIIKKDREIFTTLLSTLDDGTPNSKFLQGIIDSINNVLSNKI